MEVQEHRLEYSAPSIGRPDEPRTVKFTHWVVKYRFWILGVLIGFYIAAFTGQWRIGRDSALYRGMGHALATGHGYGFSAFGRREVYPGFPLLLAGLEKLFGRSALPPILAMHLMALVCLIATYKLVSLRFSQWFAIVITALVGFNGWFMELTNEILTDIPFLCGMMLALYGWERLRIWAMNEHPAGDPTAIARAKNRPWLSVIILLVGLVLAGTMRPTFWILGIAWVLVCAWGLIAGPGRKFYAICLTLLLVVWLAAAMADPRVKGFNPIGGGYERDAMRALADAVPTAIRQLPRLLGSELSFSFFGQQWGPGFTDVMTIVVILSSLLLLRVNPLWTLLILLTLATTLVMTVVARYYTMVLPLMLIGWMLLAVKLARRLPEKRTDAVLIIAVGLVLVPGITRCIKVIGEQRHLNDAEPEWKQVLEMSDIVRDRLSPRATVIGPAATIMSYHSDRHIVMWRDIMPAGVPISQYPQRLKKLKIHYAVFPPKIYGKGERPIRELMEHGVIVPIQRIGRTRHMALAEIRIVVPSGDWTKTPLVPVMTATGTRIPATPGHPAHVERRMSTAERKARTARHARHARNARHVRAEHKAAKVRRRRREQHEANRAARAAERQRLLHAATKPSAPAP